MDEVDDQFDKLLKMAARDRDVARDLLLTEIAHKYAAIRYPKSRKKRIAEVWLRHQYGSLAP